MTTTKRLSLIFCVTTIFGLAGVTWLRVLTQASPSRGVHPVTVVYQRVSYSDKAPIQPSFSRTEIEGVRSDGSVARAALQPRDQDRVAYYERSVADVSQGRYTVVDPLTVSTTTYPSHKYAERIRRIPASSCPGKSGEKVLGYETLSEATTVTTNAPKGKNVTTITTWRAPQLDCAMLRQETRTVKADGHVLFQVISATMVTPGDPPTWLFEIPGGYTERSPSAVQAETANKLGFSLPPQRPGRDDVYNEANKAQLAP